MKKLLVLIILANLSLYAQLPKVLNKITNSNNSNQDQIGLALKEALTNGIENQVKSLALENGFYKNELVKIKFPEEIKMVEKAMTDVGLNGLTNEGVKLLNRAAEDAVGEAIPIFKEAILKMTIMDAKNILMGNKDAATKYLEKSTSTSLKEKFYPIIQTSLQKVGAENTWSAIMKTYNKLPQATKVETDLPTYVTNEALKSVFKVIAIEELKIRKESSYRNSDLLKKVFAMQD